MVSSHATPEEPPAVNWSEYSYPNHDHRDKRKKADFMKAVVYALATWLINDDCGYHAGENQRKVPNAIMHPSMPTVPENQRINWWALQRYFRKKYSMRSTHRRALKYKTLIDWVSNPRESSKKRCARLLLAVRLTFFKYLTAQEQGFALKHHRSERNRKDLFYVALIYFHQNLVVIILSLMFRYFYFVCRRAIVQSPEAASAHRTTADWIDPGTYMILRICVLLLILMKKLIMVVLASGGTRLTAADLGRVSERFLLLTVCYVSAAIGLEIRLDMEIMLL